MDSYTSSLISLCLTALAYLVYRRWMRISIAHIPGPRSNSFLLGHLPELRQSQAGEMDFKWHEKYGDVVRFKAAFGEDRLFISDPKAIQYIHQTSGYRYFKTKERRELSRLTSGRGILYAIGDDHKRQRKVMLPGFVGPKSKSYLRIFSGCASRLTSKWKDMLSESGSDADSGIYPASKDGSGTENNNNNNKEEGIVLNVAHWLSRATLEAIGEAAFDYQFGVMDDEDNELGNAYANLLVDTFGAPTKREILVSAIMGHLPERIVPWVADHLPSPKLEHARRTARLATSVAKDLVEMKSKALLQGKGGRDVMSLLVQANNSADPKTRLNNDELYSQMRTIVLAGHETTANTLSWMFLELARHTDVQTRLRKEIRQMERGIQRRKMEGAEKGSSGSGNDEEERVGFSNAELDSMSYLNAVIKESLRFHTVAITSFRQAAQDDILPLSKPIVTTNGQVITELPIPKGQTIFTSIAAYNRKKEIFGEDAHEFNPNRWLIADGVKSSIQIGIYNNLLSFLGGVNSCIGWRFAVQEIQAFLVEIVGNFEFRLTPKALRIRREVALVMVPTVEGEIEKGVQMPLRVSLVKREDEDENEDVAEASIGCAQ